MKKIVFTLNLCLFAIIMMAQVPAGFSYQAVVRNTSGDIVASKAVKFRFSILRNTETGTSVYVETQSVTTNGFGLANLKVGMGTKVSGNFEPSDWGNNAHYLKVELDPNNGSSFTHMGTTQLLAVPYAFHAKTVEIEADGDPSNEIQELQLSGTVLGLTKSSKTVTLPSSGGGDNWGSDYVHTDATLVGQGTPAAPLKIAQQLATNGQVLKWDGTSWTPATDESGEGGSSPFTSSGGITSNSPITDNLVVGSSSLNDIAGTNDDARMFFNKTKGAFRAGKAEADQWNDSNVGTNSIALGRSTIASGDYSTAIGLRTKASGDWSTALGYNSEASGSYSFATGQSTASYNYCTAMGSNTEASGSVSTALGANTIAPSGYETAIGRYNTKYTIDKKIGWGQTDRLFVIGNGVADDQRSNALVMLKNGNTGFGVDNPTHKLEVNGQTKFTGNVGIGVDSPNNILELNGGNISDMKFFSSSSGTGNGDGLMIGTRSIPHNAYIWNFENTSLTLATNNLMRMIIAANGNVSIGDHIPSFKLDVKANNRIQLTKTNGAEWIAMRTDGSLLDLSFSGNNLAIKGMADGENILLNPAINSKVGIRTWTPQYDLDVNGNIRVIGEIYYGGSTSGTTTTKYNKPDYVFENKYKLFTIEEVGNFIEKENHLPWITSAEKEKKENGDVVDMTRMAFETVETIENLQLQIIELNKQLKAINKLIFHQQKEIEELKKMQ